MEELKQQNTDLNLTLTENMDKLAERTNDYDVVKEKLKGMEQIAQNEIEKYIKLEEFGRRERRELNHKVKEMENEVLMKRKELHEVEKLQKYKSELTKA